MPHQCTHCGKLIPDASEELLKGCECGSKFFYYIKQERLNQIEEERQEEVLKELEISDKRQIEEDIREMAGLKEEPEKPVILDIESVRVLKPGKFEIDIVKLLSKNRPLVYRLGEGKYIIDLSNTIKSYEDQIGKKIVDPSLRGYKKEKTNKEEEIEEIDINEIEKRQEIVNGQVGISQEDIEKE